jgi:HK97 family phage major capsid protein
MRNELAQAFADAFDAAALHGTNTPFDAYVAETTKSVEIGTNGAAAGGVYQDLVDGLSLLVNDGRRLTGFAFGDVAEPLLLSSVDTAGRPLFVQTPISETTTAVTPGRLLGRSSFIGEGVDAGDVVGFGGDWSKIAWGATGGITYRVSTEATVTIDGSLVSLFENNLVAILAEDEYGLVFATGDGEPVDFVKYENASS